MPDFVSYEESVEASPVVADGAQITRPQPAVVKPTDSGTSSSASSDVFFSDNLEDEEIGDTEDGCLASEDNTMLSNNVNCVPSDIEIIPNNEAYSLPPTSQIPSPVCDRMRRKLRMYFMNPLQKWKINGKFPWKLCMQIVKIIFVTVQLSRFGAGSYNYAKQQQDALITLSHIFLENWNSLSDIVSYPPSSGPYAVYTKSEFYDSINHVIKKYSNITNLVIGSYGYDSRDGSMPPLHFCKTNFASGTVTPFNETIVFNNTPRTICTDIPPLYPPGDSRWDNFSIEDFLAEKNRTIRFHKLITLHLTFNLKVVFLKSLSKLDRPDCYNMTVTVLYDNTDHDGQIMVSLKTELSKLQCTVRVDFDDDGDDFDYNLRQVLNFSVILLCSLSFILCSRSLYSGQVLRRETTKFFQLHYGKTMSFNDQLDFVDFWYVMIIVNDILIIAGSCIKIQIEQQATLNDLYTICSILLGLGNFLVWIGVLRYLGFFHKYNILILTLKKALPNVMRFMLCALLLYCGFCFCGWIVLGPYHIKFRTFSSTSECLFSLMNGDDMFATFAIMKNFSILIWWFSRVYLYSFISLFIYVVISLFISMIMDTYETIKNMYIHGSAPKTLVDIFLLECHDEDFSITTQQQNHWRTPRMTSLFDCCCGTRRSGYQRI